MRCRQIQCENSVKDIGQISMIQVLTLPVIQMGKWILVYTIGEQIGIFYLG